MTEAQTVNLAIGRIFRMASRPTQAGDVAEYERCRRLILNIIEGQPDYCAARYADHSPDYARDRLKGAQGD